MRWFNNTRYPAALAAVLASLAIFNKLPAAAPNVIYEAFGTFSKPPISGSDLFQLQGQPFSIKVTASASMAPKHSGPQWAVYTPLSMTSTVQSGLLNVPITIASNAASIELQGHTSSDNFEFATPIRLVGLPMTVNATVSMPAGTFTNLLIHPFTTAVTLTPANATLTYSDATGSTTLGIIGTLKTSVQAPAASQSIGLQ